MCHFYLPDIGPPQDRWGDSIRQLLFSHIDSLKTFWAIFGIETDCVTLGKRLKPVALDGCIMNEYIGTVFSRDKAETFGFIKPLYRSF